MSDDEIAFLRAILAEPGDRLRRLVYADWLEERADPRADWLRLAAEREVTVGSVAADLGQRLEELRSQFDPNWVSLFDQADKYTVLIPADIRKQWQRRGIGEKPLTQIDGWGNANCDFARMGIASGNYVYPLAVEKCQVFILARLRVSKLGGSARQTIIAEQPAPVRFDRQIPLPLLERMRFRTKKGTERGLKYLQEGRLLRADSLVGVYRLTHSSGQDLDRLFCHPALAEV